MATRTTEAEAVEMVRRILGAIEVGELVASTRQDLAAVRRVEGAAIALEAASQPDRKPPR